jgi:hypothetical protein
MSRPRVLALLRRVSGRIYGSLIVVLLGAVYVLVLPWLSAGWRLRRRRPGGWQRRDDPQLASVPRLRSPF